MKNILSILILTGISAVAPVAAEITDYPSDSLRSYRLGEIIVRDEHTDKLNYSKLSDLQYYKIQESDVLSFSELGIYLPSTKIRTNSRGESMLYIRGAGERQLGLFLDGASMNIPWDNRLDLSFVPADLAGRIHIDKNASSIMYGSNVLGGALSIGTLERKGEGVGTIVRIQGNDASTQMYSILNDGRFGDFNYLANVSYLNSGGFLNSGEIPDTVQNQNEGSKMRTNSSQKRLNAFIRGEYHLSDATTLGLSFSFTHQEKDVPAETHLGEDARFWRYPDRNRLMAIFNCEHLFGKLKNLWLRGTFWFDAFDQKIDSYESFAFDTIAESQQDKDKTYGGRLSLFYVPVINHTFSLVLNGNLMNHNERIDENPLLDFRQVNISPGLEYRASFEDFSISAGTVYDYVEASKTGDFTEYEGSSDSDFGAYLSATYKVLEKMSVFTDFSRRTRFPTMRESYSGALGKFKVNPSLKPETGLLGELGIQFNFESFQIRISGFADYYDNLIQQIKLSKEEDSLRRKMRVNISKADILGFEFNGFWQIMDKLSIERFFTLMNSKGEEKNVELSYLTDKPEYLAGFELTYRLNFGLKFSAEAELIGKQYEPSPDDASQYIEISSSNVFNIRAAYNLPLANSFHSEIFIRINNIFDEYRLSQLGLPEAGRMFGFGMSMQF